MRCFDDGRAAELVIPDGQARGMAVAICHVDPYHRPMPDGLYDRDILAWSEHQAELLRRLAGGERVNDVDWEHVVEEIEGVGLSELHSVESFLYQLVLHLLKMQHWPDSLSLSHWRTEIVAFQRSAARRFSPSMRQRISLESVYADAIDTIRAADEGSGVTVNWPSACPFTLDELLHEARPVLMDRLASAMPKKSRSA